MLIFAGGGHSCAYGAPVTSALTRQLGCHQLVHLVCISCCITELEQREEGGHARADPCSSRAGLEALEHTNLLTHLPRHRRSTTSE